MEESIEKDDLTWQWKLRVLLCYISLTIISAFFLILLFILSALGFTYKMRYYLVRGYCLSFVTAMKLICNIDHSIEWLDKLPKGPAIVLSNHQSFWDNIIVPHIFPMQSWIIKKELYSVPIFGLGLRLAEPIAVDRGENISVRQILNIGTEKLSEGIWLIMFPEATRLRPGRRVRMKPSGVKLAQMNNVPIVLMAHNAGMFWPKGFWIKKPGTIQVKIGNVIRVKPEDDVRKVTEEIAEWLNTEKDRLSGHLKEDQDVS